MVRERGPNVSPRSKAGVNGEADYGPQALKPQGSPPQVMLPHVCVPSQLASLLQTRLQVEKPSVVMQPKLHV